MLRIFKNGIRGEIKEIFIIIHKQIINTFLNIMIQKNNHVLSFLILKVITDGLYQSQFLTVDLNLVQVQFCNFGYAVVVYNHYIKIYHFC